MSILPAASIAPRILAADDTEDILFAMTMTLREDLKLGEEQVVETDTLESAIDRYDRDKGTLWAVFTDMQMPGGDDAGLQLYHHVRRHDPRLPVILMSAGMRPQTKERLDVVQASDPRFKFYQKPVLEFDNVLTWLRSVWRMFLIVDDEPAMLKSLRRALPSELGLSQEDFLFAADLNAAMQVFADHRQRIGGVMTDMQMPDGEDAGLQIHDSIRKLESSMPIALMSAGMRPETRARLDALLGQNQRTRFYEKTNIPFQELAAWFQSFWSGTRPA